MSTLRKYLKRPETYLALLGVGASMVLADSFRPPERQRSARAYVAMVRLYQQTGRPLTMRFIRCKFHLSCSEYSIRAVESRGIAKGLRLTVERLAACR
jgi:putative component of membrane protein insertase Oxa1/YidC/SpoIIIJ protein YidD